MISSELLHMSLLWRQETRKSCSKWRGGRVIKTIYTLLRNTILSLNANTSMIVMKVYLHSMLFWVYYLSFYLKLFRPGYLPTRSMEGGRKFSEKKG